LGAQPRAGLRPEKQRRRHIGVSELIVFDPTGCFPFSIGLSALGIKRINHHAGFQELLDRGSLTGLNGKRNRAVRLEFFPKLLPSWSGVFDLEVLNHFTCLVDNDDAVCLAGPSKAPNARCCCHCWGSFMILFCCLGVLRRFALLSIELI
jgi:hypothetical protein